MSWVPSPRSRPHGKIWEHQERSKEVRQEGKFLTKGVLCIILGTVGECVGHPPQTVPPRRHIYEVFIHQLSICHWLKLHQRLYFSALAFVSRDGAVSSWDSRSQSMRYSTHGFSSPGIYEFIVISSTFPNPPVTLCFLPW